MKKYIRISFLSLVLLPGLIYGQTAVTAVSPAPVGNHEIVNPDKLFFFIAFGLPIAFIMFIIFGLSKATSSLSNALGKHYKSNA